MTLPQYYPPVTEKAIATYNYVDIASGTGYVHFYGYADYDSVGADYFLIEEEVFSRLIERTHAFSATAGMGTSFDLSPFNLPQTIKGKAIVTFTQGVTAGRNGTMITTVSVCHVDVGDSETVLASTICPTITDSGKVLENVSITVPETHFKRGETLRLKISSTYTVSGGSGVVYMYMGIDPKDRDGTYITPSSDGKTTKIEFYCPFRISI